MFVPTLCCPAGVHLCDLWVLRRERSAQLDAPGGAGAGPHAPAAPGTGGAGGHDAGTPWDGKGSVLYHVELVGDVLMHTVTLAHYL